jgi:hypothetical protein
MTLDEIQNGLLHTADDHPCCAHFLRSAAADLRALDAHLKAVHAAFLENAKLADEAREDYEAARDWYPAREYKGECRAWKAAAEILKREATP